MMNDDTINYTTMKSNTMASPLLLLLFFAFTAQRVFTEAHSRLPVLSESVFKTRGGGGDDSSSSFEILEETIAYSRWRTITQRKVRMRNGKIVDFDLVGVNTGEGAVLVFAWDTETKTCTLVKEYMPASNKILWGIAAGLIEDKHGNDPSVAARHELEEECHLIGGTWVELSRAPSAMDKYALTHISAYLVLDAKQAINPKPLDEEEDIEIVPGVNIEEILDFIKEGEMNLVSGWGCMLAIDKLRELGEI
jgi:hypothetical protein